MSIHFSVIICLIVVCVELSGSQRLEEPCEDDGLRCKVMKNQCHRYDIGRKCRYTCNRPLCVFKKSPNVVRNQNPCELTENTPSQSTIDTFQNAQYQFAVKFYQLSRTIGPQNVFFSPISISIAFGMLLGGAKGITATEIAREFLRDVRGSEIYSTYAWLLRLLNQERSSYDLYSANALYTHDNLVVDQNFTRIADECMQSSMQLRDFTSYADPVRKQVNHWVARKTNGKIRNLVPPGAVNSRTRMILVNALYFKGQWLHPFTKQATTFPGYFYPLKDVANRKAVNYMAKIEQYPYYHDKKLQIQILGLPYKGNEVTMFIILPDARDSLPRLESALTGARLRQLLSQTANTRVEVTIPKFQMEQSLPLKSLLMRMGVRSVFEMNRADLSGISGDGQLYVSDAFHKAFIEVNEEGTEAGAATGIMVVLRAATPTIPKFKADHSFLFLIRHEATDSILFMGAMLDVAAA